MFRVFILTGFCSIILSSTVCYAQTDQPRLFGDIMGTDGLVLRNPLTVERMSYTPGFDRHPLPREMEPLQLAMSGLVTLGGVYVGGIVGATVTVGFVCLNEVVTCTDLMFVYLIGWDLGIIGASIAMPYLLSAYSRTPNGSWWKTGLSVATVLATTNLLFYAAGRTEKRELLLQMGVLGVVGSLTSVVVWRLTRAGATFSLGVVPARDGGAASLMYRF